MRLLVRAHNLAGHPSRMAKFILPTSKPFLLDCRAFHVRQVGLGVAIHQKSNR
jgi:hypothetical protein